MGLTAIRHIVVSTLKAAFLAERSPWCRVFPCVMGCANNTWILKNTFIKHYLHHELKSYYQEGDGIAIGCHRFDGVYVCPDCGSKIKRQREMGHDRQFRQMGRKGRICCNRAIRGRLLSHAERRQVGIVATWRQKGIGLQIRAWHDYSSGIHICPRGRESRQVAGMGQDLRKQDIVQECVDEASCRRLFHCVRRNRQSVHGRIWGSHI